MSETITRFIPEGDQILQFAGKPKLAFSRQVLAEIIGRGRWQGDVVIMPCNLLQIDLKDGLAAITVQQEVKDAEDTPPV